MFNLRLNYQESNRMTEKFPEPESFSPDEVETIKALLEDWGFEYALSADQAKVIALAQRLGLHDLAKRLT